MAMQVRADNLSKKAWPGLLGCQKSDLEDLGRELKGSGDCGPACEQHVSWQPIGGNGLAHGPSRQLPSQPQGFGDFWQIEPL